MDNKKLMHILLQDMQDLENLVDEIIGDRKYDTLGMELLKTRISGAKHLLQVFSGMVHSPEKPPAESEKPFIQREPVKEVPAPAMSGPEKESAVIDKGKKEQTIPVVEPVFQDPGQTPVIAVPEPKQVKEEAPLKGDLEFEEKEPLPAEKQTLGEKFTAGKSVNDLLLEKGKSDPKFTHLPIESLASAIGINDRFLFVRELFDGKSEEFNETISQIDLMKDIHEAAAYLRNRYKWKKSETSLKFIDLVKRRFS